MPWNKSNNLIYKKKKVQNVYLPFNSDIVPFRYYTVSSMDVGRPDLISYKVYNDKNYWWIILHANNIFDVVNELKANTQIKIPNLSDYLKQMNKRSI